MIRRAVLAAVVSADLTACGGPAAELERLARGEAGRVAEVRAGDAFVLADGLTVRLAGVEAPHGDDPGADAGRAALSALVLGKDVQLYYGGARRDRYDRAIAQVRVKGGAWVEQALLEAGAVRVHTWPDNQALAKPMLTAEARARVAGRGLWSMPAYRVLLPSEAVTSKGFVVVEGRVARVTDQYAGAVIDFSEGGIEASIPRSGLRELNAAGRGPSTWAGQVVRMRGWLTGNRLRVDHLSAVEQVSIHR